jgi:hypothetical protein
MLYRLILLFWILCGTSVYQLSAQELPLFRESLPTNYWTFLNSEYYFAKGSFLFYEGNLRSSADVRFNTIQSLPAGFMHHLLGYEQRLNEHWAIGLSGRLANRQQRQEWYTRLLLNHHSQIGTTAFLKQISVERLDRLSIRQGAEGRFMASLALSRNIRIAGKERIRVVGNYDAAFWFPIDGRPPFYDNKRRFDLTRFRLEVAWLFSEQWSASIFAIHDTQYFFAIAQFDANGEMIKPDRRLNLLTPTIGFRLHARFFNTALSKDTTPLRALAY